MFSFLVRSSCPIFLSPFLDWNPCGVLLLQQGLEVDTLLDRVPDGRLDDLQHHAQIGIVLGVVSIFISTQTLNTSHRRNASAGRCRT